MMQQPAKRELLLVAAGQFGDSLRWTLRAHVQPLHPISRGLALQAIANVTESGQGLVAGNGEVVGQAEVEHQAFLLAIFAEQTHSLGQMFGRGTASALD